MLKFPKKLQQKLSLRANENALRTLSEQTTLIDFSSNDYLGMARNKEIHTLALQSLEKIPSMVNGGTGSRLLSGNHQLFDELERYLANFHETEAALVFNSGYDANIGFFSSVPQRGDIVFYDELVHASIRDGIQMGNAKAYKFRHNDVVDLKNKVALSLRAQSRSKDSETYIVTESVFSMDGDSPDLKELAQFCNDNKFRFVVDEAHANGIFGAGKGLVNELQLEKEVFARIVTFGKAMGAHGAAILGDEELKAYLINFARSFIYTTALPPHTVAGVLESYNYLVRNTSDERERLLGNISFFKSQLKKVNLESHFIDSDAAIQSAIIPTNGRVKEISHKLMEKGFDVRPILSPTVPKGSERLRFCLHSFNTHEEISSVLHILDQELVAES